MKKDEFERILKMSWSIDTCVPSLQKVYTNDNPALGQCAITAIIVNDLFGGKIMRTMTKSGSHYYNLINGEIIDYTASQFEDGVIPYEIGEERSRDYLLSNEDTKNRYNLLWHNMENNFLKYGAKEYKLRDGSNQEYISKIPGLFGGNKREKIYGLMDCPSANRWIEKGYYKDNRVFFATEDDAVEAGYRPCKICMKKRK